MKNLLVGLLAFGSISSFASNECTIAAQFVYCANEIEERGGVSFAESILKDKGYEVVVSNSKYVVEICTASNSFFEHRRSDTYSYANVKLIENNLNESILLTEATSKRRSAGYLLGIGSRLKQKMQLKKALNQLPDCNEL
jgi:hypothetical protein